MSRSPPSTSATSATEGYPMSDQRDAIAAAIRDALLEVHAGVWPPGMPSRVVAIAVDDAIAPFVEAARAEGYEQGVRDALTAAESSDSDYGQRGAEAAIEKLLAVLEQREDVGYGMAAPESDSWDEPQLAPPTADWSNNKREQQEDAG